MGRLAAERPAIRWNSFFGNSGNPKRNPDSSWSLCFLQGPRDTTPLFADSSACPDPGQLWLKKPSQLPWKSESVSETVVLPPTKFPGQGAEFPSLAPTGYQYPHSQRSVWTLSESELSTPPGILGDGHLRGNLFLWMRPSDLKSLLFFLSETLGVLTKHDMSTAE